MASGKIPVHVIEFAAAAARFMKGEYGGLSYDATFQRYDGWKIVISGINNTEITITRGNVE